MVRHRLGEITTVITEDGPEYTIVWYAGRCGDFRSGDNWTPDTVAALPGYLAGGSVMRYWFSDEPDMHTGKFKPKPRVTKAARA